VRTFFHLLVSLSCLLGVVPAFALSAADVEQLKPGAQLQLPVADSDEDKLETMQIDRIGLFSDQDGTRWFRLETHRPDGQAATVLLTLSASKVEASVVLRRLKLRDFGASPKQLWKFDKFGEGEVVFEDQHYRFSADDSEDSRFTDGSANSAPKELSYYTFHCVEDDDLSLVVLEWSDDEFEALHTGWVDAERITVK